MKNQLNISEKLPTADISRLLNSQNGNDSEILSASNIINAFNAEVRWGSRNEDNSKIDLFISYNHPWNNNERIILLVQIKSGPSYGKVSNGKVTLYKRAFKEVKRNLNNICLIWLDHNTGENYWTYIHPNTNVQLTEFGRNHILTPAIRFEIARSITRNHTFNKTGGKGIILNLNVTQSPISTYRKSIKSIYNRIGTVLNPLFGTIEFTEFGWNHMFRNSRNKIFKSHSLYIIPYLKQILKHQPSKHWINSFEPFTRKEFEFCQYEHVLTYEDIKSNTNLTGKVIVKIIEEVGYPKLWKQETLLSQKIIRRVIIKSCSWKEI